MQVTIINGESKGHYFTVHKTGCRDIQRTLNRNHCNDIWPTMEFSSRIEIAIDIWSDHISEGSMTEDDAMDDFNTHFAPCCKELQ